ncbi:MAG: molybdopterin cofactor-binding domain-containing protein [Pseudomonadota bacterium]
MRARTAGSSGTGTGTGPRLVTRRRLLAVSAAVAGGVAFGAWRLAQPHDNPLLDGLADRAAAPTPFVRIDAAGVTLITPRADVGQGIQSLQAHLIAEELDVDPHAVALEPGPVAPAYYNAALMAEGVPFAAWDRGVVATTARTAAAAMAHVLGIHATGGSTSTPDLFDRLRLAGAVARETLKAAAAHVHGVARADLTTAAGAVVLPDGTRVAYSALAAQASTLDPVTDVALRPASAWRHLGRPMARTDMAAKCTGRLAYGADLRPVGPAGGTLFATVRLNPAFDAPMRHHDATAARAMRGVHAVVPFEDGIGVVADNTWRAMQAAEAVQIAWDPPAYPPTTEALWAHLDAAHTPDRRDSRLRDDGDVDAALAGTVLEAEYRVPLAAHAPLEPVNATVLITPERVEVWTATQVPGFARDAVAAALGRDGDTVVLHALPAGGSFGRRLEVREVVLAARLAAAVPGRPVQSTWTRAHEMSRAYPRPPQIGRLKGAVRDGRVHALALDSIAPSMVESWAARLWSAPPGPDAWITIGGHDQPYALPHYRVTGYRAPASLPVASWRAPGATANAFCHEGFLDELIHAAGADPVAERLRLLHHAPSRAVLQAVAEMAGWQGPHLPAGADGPRGRGVAFCLSHGVPAAVLVEVTATDRGIRLDRAWATADIGRVLDPVNAEAQLSGAVLFGLGHAIDGALTLADGHVQQRNFDSHAGLRIDQVPTVEVRLLETGARLRGLGEPGTPPAAPALAAAVFAATGTRLRAMPFADTVDFA